MSYYTAAYIKPIKWDSGCSGPCIDAMRANRCNGRISILIRSDRAEGRQHMFNPLIPFFKFAI